MNCDLCKKKFEGFYGAITKWNGERKFVKGHEACIRLLQEGSGQTYLKKFIWGDGQKGSYSPGWLADVKRRRVVGQGEVIRDYGRKYFT